MNVGHFPKTHVLSQKGKDEFYNQKLAASLILAIDPIYLTLQKSFPLYKNYLLELFKYIIIWRIKKILLMNLSVINI